MGNKLIRALRELSLLADEAMADRILHAERLKSAELRLQMIEREDQHMCLRPACRKPVAGERIFAHCEHHLTSYERRWLEEEIESPQPEHHPDEKSEHSITKALNDLAKTRDLQLVKENVLKKEQAVADARCLLDKASELASERRAFLPERLKRRLSENQSAQEEEIGWQADDD